MIIMIITIMNLEMDIILEMDILVTIYIMIKKNIMIIMMGIVDIVNQRLLEI